MIILRHTEAKSSEPVPIDTRGHAPPGFLAWVARLVHDHRQRLLTYARRRGLDAEASLDAVQDSFVSFLRLPQARDMAQDNDDAIKLLTVILRHNIQNARRKHLRRDHSFDAFEQSDVDSEDSETLITRAEELARVHGCILRMALLQRRVVLLSLVDEQPRDEIAKALGISPQHLRVILHRAREHVRHCTFAEDDQTPV